MSERLDHARELGQRVAAGWQHEDVEAQLARLHARQRARARRRALAAPLAAAALAAAIVASITSVASPRRPEPPRSAPTLASAPVAVPPPIAAPTAVAPVPPPAAPVTASGVLSLGDGSVVTPLGTGSRLRAQKVSDTDVVVELAGGSARFDVPDRKGRRFRTDLGAVALETHGAAFRVGITPRQIEVVAERGELSAHIDRERHVVAAGQTWTFPIAAHDAARADHDPQVPAPPPPSSWRDDAARGDYAAAWLAFAGSATPLDTMADLLLAGDVARLSGHADAAVAQLARAVVLHPDDPRAPLAAFTLGRVHLEELGAPRDAAQAFARARELAPAGPLAEDALAREVEAWSRAGETQTARAQALAYTHAYPQGRRIHAVRRFGGLEGGP